jgi:phage baseplate assembly protein W
MTTGFAFPFGVGPSGTVRPAASADAELQGRIVQVLFTAPGERVNEPTFGCGLANLVFDPNNPILAAAVEFTAGQALTRWLGEEIVVAGVNVAVHDETLTVEVVYIRRSDRARQSLRVQFK